MGLFLLPAQKQRNQERVVVKTYSLSVKESLPNNSPLQATPMLSKPVAKQPQNKTTPKIAPQKTPIKKSIAPQEKEKKSAIRVPGHLLRELEETIAQIDKSRQVSSGTKKTVLPQMIKPLESEKFHPIDDSHSKANYQETLIFYLHQSLNLPDFGEVTVQIKLRKEGSIENITILKAESDKNRKYLETHLPLLKFPPLQDSSTKKENTFILTFCNEL